MKYGKVGYAVQRKLIPYQTKGKAEIALILMESSTFFLRKGNFLQ